MSGRRKGHSTVDEPDAPRRALDRVPGFLAFERTGVVPIRSASTATLSAYEWAQLYESSAS